MQPFHTLTSLAAPLDRANIDTDQLIPKQFLKRIERTGYGDFLFFDWRRNAAGDPGRRGVRRPRCVLLRDMRCRVLPGQGGCAILTSGLGRKTPATMSAIAAMPWPSSEPTLYGRKVAPLNKMVHNHMTRSEA